MISACTGVPGSGKSFYAVQRALAYMASGGAVFSNIRLHGVEKVDVVAGDGEPGQPSGVWDQWKLSAASNVRSVLRKEYGWEYVDSHGGQYHYIDLDTMDDGFLQAVPRGSPSKRILLILDEVNEWFDSLDNGKLKEKDGRYREMFKFLRLSRHYHIDVLFLLQDFSTLNARLRGLCAGIIKTTDMQKMRVPGVPFCFPFPWFLLQEYDKSGKHCLKSTTWPKEKAIFSCYDSFCEFGAVSLSSVVFNSDFSGEGKPKKKGSSKMTKWDRVLLVACCAIVCLFSGGFLGRSSGGGAGTYGVEVREVVITNRVSFVESAGLPAVEKEKSRPRITVEYAYMSFHQAGDDIWVYADGKHWKKGQRHPEGLVVEVDRDFIKCVDGEGYEHYIYNRQTLTPELRELARDGGKNKMMPMCPMEGMN